MHLQQMSRQLNESRRGGPRKDFFCAKWVVRKKRKEQKASTPPQSEASCCDDDNDNNDDKDDDDNDDNDNDDKDDMMHQPINNYDDDDVGAIKIMHQKSLMHGSGSSSSRTSARSYASSNCAYASASGTR